MRRYLEAVGRFALLGAVRRIKHPGCKFDSMLVLEGLTNAGKSMSVQALSPNEEWVLEDLSLGTDAKVVIERTEGKWLVEVSELVFSKKSDINRIKSFISLKTDVARKAYGRSTTKRPRSFVFIATTNEAHYLEDKTGNRRYWPVKCGDVIDFRALATDRDQLWAEAIQKEPGVDLFLTGELLEIAKRQQASREVVDDWEEFIRNTLGDGPGWVKAESLWRRLDRPIGQVTASDSRRMGTILTRLGFKSTVLRVRALKRQVRVWMRCTEENFDPGTSVALLEEDRHWAAGEDVATPTDRQGTFI